MFKLNPMLDIKLKYFIYGFMMLELIVLINSYIHHTVGLFFYGGILLTIGFIWALFFIEDSTKETYIFTSYQIIINLIKKNSVFEDEIFSFVESWRKNKNTGIEKEQKATMNKILNSLALENIITKNSNGSYQTNEKTHEAIKFAEKCLNKKKLI